MICMAYDRYGASMVTLIFITCIWVPFLEIKHGFFKILSPFVMFYAQADHGHHHRQNVFPNIYHHAASRFSDLLDGGGDDHQGAGSATRWLDETCSICLSEFQSEDTVSQLSRCRHVFHTCCIETWLNGDQFTCPLCRSNLLYMPEKHVRQNQNPYDPFFISV